MVLMWAETWAVFVIAAALRLWYERSGDRP